MDNPEFVVVLTTVPSDSNAGQFAAALVEARVAACVNVLGDMRSTYRWDDEIEVETERQLLIKTTRETLPALWEKVRDLHPSEIPEFVVLPIIDGSAAYLNWLRESTSGQGSAPQPGA
jgi:periplasmic divalent cation tolerance protein